MWAITQGIFHSTPGRSTSTQNKRERKGYGPTAEPEKVTFRRLHLEVLGTVARAYLPVYNKVARISTWLMLHFHLEQHAAAGARSEAAVEGPANRTCTPKCRRADHH